MVIRHRSDNAACVVIIIGGNRADVKAFLYFSVYIIADNASGKAAVVSGNRAGIQTVLQRS